ncbi:hypothetical protein ABW20_dc0107161 [Dactylellina cionopaga]|nr:hypothetical protein ABW20_dc0107161 [Dactylellina cionopaga]
MPLAWTERYLAILVILSLTLPHGRATPQGFEGEINLPESEPLNKATRSSDPNEPRLKTVRETLAENDQNTPPSRGTSLSQQNYQPNFNALSQGLGLQTQLTIYAEKDTQNTLCDLFKLNNPWSRPSDSCRTRDNSPSGSQYDINPLSSDRYPRYETKQLQPKQQFNITTLRLQDSVFTCPQTPFRGSYGNMNPIDTARGTSRKVVQLINRSDEDEDLQPPTAEPDEDPITSNYNATPNMDLSITPEGDSFFRQGTQSFSRVGRKPSASPPKKTTRRGLKYFPTNPYVNSVTWFKYKAEEDSTLSKLEPVWQGEFIQPPTAKGFLLAVLNTMTDDIWVVAKQGFPYEGYNLYTQKFVEAEAARWTKIDRRLYLSETKPVVYTCTNAGDPVALSLIHIKEALKLEGKSCPNVGGKFISWGWELRRSESSFVDPRIEGTLFWEGVSPSGSLQSIYPPENDGRLWWSVRRPNGDRRRVPLVGFLASPTKSIANIGAGSTESEKVARKMPYLARYKPLETDNSHFLNRFEEDVWYKRPFQISGAFVQTAKQSTLVPWHLYVEEIPKIDVGTKTTFDRFLVARQDGRETAPIKPTSWIAKRLGLPEQISYKIVSIFTL